MPETAREPRAKKAQIDEYPPPPKPAAVPIRVSIRQRNTAGQQDDDADSDATVREPPRAAESLDDERHDRETNSEDGKEEIDSEDVSSERSDEVHIDAPVVIDVDAPETAAIDSAANITFPPSHSESDDDDKNGYTFEIASQEDYDSESDNQDAAECVDDERRKSDSGSEDDEDNDGIVDTAIQQDIIDVDSDATVVDPSQVEEIIFDYGDSNSDDAAESMVDDQRDYERGFEEDNEDDSDIVEATTERPDNDEEDNNDDNASDEATSERADDPAIQAAVWNAPFAEARCIIDGESSNVENDVNLHNRSIPRDGEDMVLPMPPQNDDQDLVAEHFVDAERNPDEALYFGLLRELDAHLHPTDAEWQTLTQAGEPLRPGELRGHVFVLHKVTKDKNLHDILPIINHFDLTRPFEMSSEPNMFDTRRFDRQVCMVGYSHDIRRSLNQFCNAVELTEPDLMMMIDGIYPCWHPRIVALKTLQHGGLELFTYDSYDEFEVPNSKIAKIFTRVKRNARILAESEGNNNPRTVPCNGCEHRVHIYWVSAIIAICFAMCCLSV